MKNTLSKFLAGVALVLMFTGTVRADGSSGGTVKSVPVVGAQGSCQLSGMTGTTQCVGVPTSGFSYYITSFTCSANAAISCGLSSSTTAGNACATSPATVIPAHYIPANGGFTVNLTVPIKVAANSALCCTPSATTGVCQVVYVVAK